MITNRLRGAIVRRLAAFTTILLTVGLFLGCIESKGFYYPEAGLRFRPRSDVETQADYRNASMANEPRYNVIVPPTLSIVGDDEDKRIITTGIEGLWTVTERPLFDEVAITCYDEGTWCNYELVEEKRVEIPWRGVYPPEGIARTWHLTSTRTVRYCGCCGCRTVRDTTEQYTYTVTIYHAGNTIEFCWRENSRILATDSKIQQLFNCTDGVSFISPRTPGENTDTM